MKEPIVVRYKDVKPWVATTPDHREVRVMLSPKRDGSKEGVAAGVVEMPPGYVAPAHSHETEQEAWYFFAGKGQIKVGDTVVDVEPGTMVASPPQTPHALINMGTETLKAVLMFTWSGPEESLIVE